MQFISIIIILIHGLLYAAPVELVSKQSTKNIRYISKDGKVTYYQGRNGILKFSKNYSIKELIQGNEYDNFLIFDTPNSNKIIIKQIKNPHRFDSFNSNHKLFLTTIGSTKVKEVGNGHSPVLHLNGSFLSYIDTSKNDLVIVNLAAGTKKRIALSKKHSPYFKAQAVMPNPNFIIYTDINIKGYTAVLLYDLAEKKFETLYKTSYNGQKVDICYKDQQLIVGDFSYKSLNATSAIILVDIYDFKNPETKKILYSSSLQDLGQMICHNNSIYFLKTILHQEKINYKTTDAAKLNLDSGKLTILTNLNDITQINRLGDMIITNYKGKYLIIDGSQQIEDDSLGAKE